MLSPVLFTLYIDKLLNRLRQSKLGCYVGDIFMGAFAYADDVALLAPTIMSLNKLINVCVSFAREYHVLFNPIKSKLIAFNCATTENIYVTFDGISKDVHQGNIVGECSNEIRIKGVVFSHLKLWVKVVETQLQVCENLNYLIQGFKG